MSARDDLIDAIASKYEATEATIWLKDIIANVLNAIDRLDLRVGGVAERAVLDAAAAMESWRLRGHDDTPAGASHHHGRLTHLTDVFREAVRAWRGAAPTGPTAEQTRGANECPSCDAYGICPSHRAIHEQACRARGPAPTAPPDVVPCPQCGDDAHAPAPQAQPGEPDYCEYECEACRIQFRTVGDTTIRALPAAPTAQETQP